ncbi:MAG: amidohydrolase [Lachnospiraceae bacterium]
MEKEELKRRCIEAIDKRKEDIIRLGEKVYRNPELGYKEFETTKCMEEAFASLGLKTVSPIAYTGCKASAGGKEKPVVAVMGELDSVVCPEHEDCAVNGNMHACGHNVQLANLYGCAAGLVESGVIKELPGLVEFIAIPAEECVDFDYRDKLIEEGKIEFYGGKQEYLLRGGMDNIDMILQCHMMEVDGGRKCCTVNTDTDGFISKNVKFIGRASHAGAAPHAGINAVNMAQLALNNINALRETFREEDMVRVSAIITSGGELVNVVPSTVTMQVMVRAATVEAMTEASEKVGRALKAGALAIGGKVEIRDQIGYLPLSTDHALSALYRENMIAYGGADENSFVEFYKTAGSTDLGDMSQLVPCMHVWASGITGGLHSKDFKIRDFEKAYILPAKMLALTVIDLLYEDAGKAKEVIEAYKPKFTKETYINYMKEHSAVELFDGSAI